MKVRSHFHGMSAKEMDGMPYLVEGDLVKLGMSPIPAVRIAKAQEEYVRDVYRRCPGWRWKKKRKLGEALRYAAAVSAACSYGGC